MSNPPIQTIIEKILQKMDIPFDSVSVADEEGAECSKFLVKSASAGPLLIGARGEHLMALNHVISRIVAKTSGEDKKIRFFVDVNNYQSKLVEELKLKAKIMGERARSFKASVEMPPMSSYERMLVHTYLESAPDLKTESVGEGKERRIVIRYMEHKI